MLQLAYEVTKLDPKADARGVLAEIVSGLPARAQVYVFTIRPGYTRGHHWHERKTEWFVCVKGEAHIVLELDKGRGERAEFRLTDDLLERVQVNPGVKHTFSSSSGATILACVSESFDPGDPDTYYC